MKQKVIISFEINLTGEPSRRLELLTCSLRMSCSTSWAKMASNDYFSFFLCLFLRSLFLRLCVAILWRLRFLPQGICYLLRCWFIISCAFFAACDAGSILITFSSHSSDLALLPAFRFTIPKFSTKISKWGIQPCSKWSINISSTLFIFWWK